MDFFKLK